MFKWFTLAQSSALSYCPVSLFQTSSVSLKDNWIYFRFWHFILAPISRVLARFIPCSWSSSCFCTFLCTTQWLHQFKCHQCQHTNSPLVLNVGLSQIFERIQLLVVYAAWLWIALPSCFVFFSVLHTLQICPIFSWDHLPPLLPSWTFYIPHDHVFRSRYLTIQPCPFCLLYITVPWKRSIRVVWTAETWCWFQVQWRVARMK